MSEARAELGPRAAGLESREWRIEKAVNEWYSAAWHRGVRITGVERSLLARFLARRKIRNG